MQKITFCIPSKSNLRYLKTCIPSIRKNAYRDDHDIIVFVDSDEDGTVEWLQEHADEYGITYYVNPYLGEKLFGIGKAYDFCVEKSNTEVFMIFHADMMLGKHADLNAYNHLKRGSVVCSTRIEPPIHPNAGEKILLDFGMWPEDFKEDEFNSYVESQLSNKKITQGIFAPWMMYKDEFLSMGGHDPILKSAREDSDVFNRLSLRDFNFIQPWNSLVYHLTGRGGQFQHGKITQDHEQKSKEWQRLMNNSTKEFIRKWGSIVKHTELMKPIVQPRYDISFVVENANELLVQTLEPFCDRLYVDNALINGYIESEQPNSMFDISKKVLPITNKIEGGVVIKFDARRLDQNNYNLLTMMPTIINDSGEIGVFELGIFNVEIQSMKRMDKELITLDSAWYLNKLRKNND